MLRGLDFVFLFVFRVPSLSLCYFRMLSCCICFPMRSTFGIRFHIFPRLRLETRE